MVRSPSPERNVSGRCIISVRHETEIIDISQQQRSRVTHRCNVRPTRPTVDGELPLSIAAVERRDGDPFNCAAIGISNPIATSRCDDRRDSVATVVHLIFGDRGQRHVAGVVEHRRVVDSRQVDRSGREIAGVSSRVP